MQERSELFEMTGSVETIIFRNEKNGYTILEIDNGQEIVTAVGTMPWVSVGAVSYTHLSARKEPRRRRFAQLPCTYRCPC